MTGSLTTSGQSTLSAHHHHQRRHHPHPTQSQQLNCLSTASQRYHSTPIKHRDKHTVHWFRKGLRLHDNPSFARGVHGSTTFRCVFIIDPWFAGSSNVGINKWRFLLQCLEDLDRSLKKLNSRLFVIRGQPADALPKLFKKWGTTCLSFEEDPEPFGKVRDQHIQKLCAELGVDVVKIASHTLYKLDNIIGRNGGVPPLTYNQFQKIIESMGAPLLPDPMVSPEHLSNSRTPTSEDHDEKYGVPSLLELGFDTDNLMSSVWIGGETEALARLERHLERKAWVASFAKPKMTPQSLLASQTGLSPYLRFGCLSTRLFYQQLTDLYKKIKKTSPPLSLHGQILWREFFYCAATNNSNFDRIESNEICVQIPWQQNPTALAKWANGHTGFPWIDAIMVQLRTEGWIHHLARHSVACFLTRGDLWISWEEGMKVFAELLLDADWSVNAGSWMWMSGSSFFQQFFSSYCPVKFGRKADPNGDFIRRYLPVLKNFPVAYIHEPWTASDEVQRMAHCIIGRDYPLPMVNHDKVFQINMQRLAQVYKHLRKIDRTIPIINSNSSNNNPASFTPSETHFSNPSPNTMIASINNSGNYVCQPNIDERGFLMSQSSAHHSIMDASAAPQGHQQQSQPQTPSHLQQSYSNAMTHAVQTSAFPPRNEEVTPMDNHQLIYNNESNYSSLMQHLYANDDQNLPNIDCGADMFSPGKFVSSVDQHPAHGPAINLAAQNDCHPFRSQQNAQRDQPSSSSHMMGFITDHPPTTGMATEFYDQPPFDTGVMVDASDSDKAPDSVLGGGHLHRPRITMAEMHSTSGMGKDGGANNSHNSNAMQN